ncbi:MAG: hypothetical protein IPJ19_07920 [Planctomycetes bacterium]|nr:hypothetical protein [Planctomycetota bacterium]
MHILLTLPLLFPALPQDPPPAAAPETPHAALVVGQPTPKLRLEPWIVEPKKPENVGVSSRSGVKGEPLGEFAQRWSNHHEAWIVFRAPLAQNLPLLAQLGDACSDRALGLVAWTDADGEAAAKEGLGLFGGGAYLGIPHENSPLGADTPELLVVGPSGELVWTGTAAQEKDFLAAVGEALARPKAQRFDAPFAPELAGVLTDYWKGSWAKARAAADKLARKGGNEALVADAQRLVAAVDELERELSVAAQQAIPTGQLAEAVEIETLLDDGLPGATRKHVGELLKDVAGKSLQGGAVEDARKWLEIAAKRPLFFPARSEPAGERFAKELEQFAKRSSNQAAPQQRALALLERWKQRKAR